MIAGMAMVTNIFSNQFDSYIELFTVTIVI